MQEYSDILNQARLTGTPIPQLSAKIKPFSRDMAYSIQEMGIHFREAQGEKIVGYKMGLTSKAKRDQMNLDAPLYGVLTDKMEVQNGGSFSFLGSTHPPIHLPIHPKIEPELAFLIGKDLKGEVTLEEVMEACDGVCAALEILDSRYEHFKYFSMEDVIADNSSSSYFVLGSWLRDFRDIDVKNLEMKMFTDGQVREVGKSGNISGDPWLSVVELCRLLALRDKFLPSGSIVLAGAATTAVNLESGMDVKLLVNGLPEVQVFIKE